MSLGIKICHCIVIVRARSIIPPRKKAHHEETALEQHGGETEDMTEVVSDPRTTYHLTMYCGGNLYKYKKVVCVIMGLAR